jgi:hypothetical protein
MTTTLTSPGRWLSKVGFLSQLNRPAYSLVGALTPNHQLSTLYLPPHNDETLVRLGNK